MAPCPRCGVTGTRISGAEGQTGGHQLVPPETGAHYYPRSTSGAKAGGQEPASPPRLGWEMREADGRPQQDISGGDLKTS